LPIAEEFEASSSKYLVGLVANVEVLHYIKKSKHGVGLGLGAKKIFTDSFSYSFPEKMGTSKQKLYLSGYNFYIQYRLKIF
jgi:hypothetical protein